MFPSSLSLYEASAQYRTGLRLIKISSIIELRVLFNCDLEYIFDPILFDHSHQCSPFTRPINAKNACPRLQDKHALKTLLASPFLNEGGVGIALYTLSALKPVALTFHMGPARVGEINISYYICGNYNISIVDICQYFVLLYRSVLSVWRYWTRS